MEVDEPAAGEERPWHIQRAPPGLAPSNGGHARTGCERIAPFGRGGHSRADDGHFVRVLVRLVRMHGSLVPRELCREGEARVTRCQQDMAEASVAVEREALVDAPDPRDADEPDTLVPGRSFALLGDVVEKLLDRRVEAVAHALHQRRN